MEFHFKKSWFRVKSRFKEWKDADGGHLLNRDFTAVHLKHYTSSVLTIQEMLLRFILSWGKLSAKAEIPSAKAWFWSAKASWLISLITLYRFSLINLHIPSHWNWGMKGRWRRPFVKSRIYCCTWNITPHLPWRYKKCSWGSFWVEENYPPKRRYLRPKPDFDRPKRWDPKRELHLDWSASLYTAFL